MTEDPEKTPQIADSTHWRKTNQNMIL